MFTLLMSDDVQMREIFCRRYSFTAVEGKNAVSALRQFHPQSVVFDIDLGEQALNELCQESNGAYLIAVIPSNRDMWNWRAWSNVGRFSHIYTRSGDHF